MKLWYQCEYCEMIHSLKTAIWKCSNCKTEICDNCTDIDNLPELELCEYCATNKLKDVSTNE